MGICLFLIDTYSNKRLNINQVKIGIDAMDGSSPDRTPEKPGLSSRADRTREALIEHAEKLIASHGFHNVSVRDITQAAGANIAAINYHFGGKSGLLLAAFERRARELARVRVARLRKVMESNAPGARDIYRALLSPPLEWMAEGEGRQSAIAMLIRAHLDGSDEVLNRIFRDVSVASTFADVSGMSAETARTRIFFALAMEHEIILNLPRLASLRGVMPASVDKLALLEDALDLLAG